MRCLYVCPQRLISAEQERVKLSARTGPAEGDHPVLDCFISAPTSDPGPDTLCLIGVNWDNWRAQEKFEQHPEVIPLGEPWEPVPPAAIPTLEAYRLAVAPDRVEALKGTAKKILPVVKDADAPIDTTHTISQALRKAQPNG